MSLVEHVHVYRNDFMSCKLHAFSDTILWWETADIQLRRLSGGTVVKGHQNHREVINLIEYPAKRKLTLLD